MHLRPRVRQLRRTELAGELEAPNVSALPTKSKLRGDPVRKNAKGNYEKDSVIIISKSVRVWRSAIDCRLHSSTVRRNSSVGPHSLW